MSDKPHVLIVEDEEILVQFLVYHVEQAGYRATAVNTGGEIFHVLETDPVNLILLDLGLPDGDGLTRAQQIREKFETPIIVLTARQGTDDRLMALGLGADDYLTKPCDPRELLLRMRNVLARCAAAPQPEPETPPAKIENPGAKPTPQPAPQPAPPQPRAPEPGPRDATPPKREGMGKSLIAIAIALLIFVVGGGAWWYLTQVPEPARPQPAASALTPPTQAPQATAPSPSAAREPAAPPASAPAPAPLDVTVTAQPNSAVTNEEALETAVTSPAKSPSGPPISATSYSWVLKSKCPKLPQLDWWSFKDHTDIVRYVNRRHGGDWQPYIQSWVDRLSKLQDIYSRNSGIKTNTGKVLQGADLKEYIDQTQARLDVTICLSREAADFAHKKSLLQR